MDIDMFPEQPVKYYVTVSSLAWLGLNIRQEPTTASPSLGKLFPGETVLIDDRDSTLTWGHFEKGWISLAWTSPRPEPNLYRALFGNERPDIGWLTPPYGTFDNIPLLKRKVFEKGGGFNITPQMWKVISSWNPSDKTATQQQKLAWLIGHEGKTDMVLSEVNGILRQHTPEISGGAIVNVLGIDGKFARIECHPITKPLPQNVPVWLRYTWTALTKSGASYYPRGGVEFPILYFTNWAYVPLAWLKKV